MSSSFRAKAEGVLGRSVALAALVLFMPALLLMGFLLRANSDEPVLLTDEVLSMGGTRVCIHRLRTTGPGTNAFRTIGRVVRSLGYDDLPALWDVVRGQIGFLEFCHLVRK